MEFTCDKNELCGALGRVSRAVAQKSPIPALEGIYLEMTPGEVILAGYDMEIGIRTRLKADCTENFSCVLGARLFIDMARSMTGDTITFQFDENFNVQLISGDTRYRLSVMSAEEFPALPVVESDEVTRLPEPLLRSMIRQTLFAAAVKEDKPILTGELFEAENGHFCMVGMDKFRLALRQEPVQDIGDFRYVVPGKALSELEALLSDDKDAVCEFATNGRHIVFRVGTFELFARLLEGKYHDYRKSIPETTQNLVTMSVRELTGCAQRCLLLISEKHKAPMVCEFHKDELEVTCQTALGEIHDKVPCDLEGAGLTIGLNTRYLLEALRACDTDKVLLHMDGSTRVLKITPLEGDDFVYLIMPINLKKIV